jgi:hypothetical protein
MLHPRLGRFTQRDPLGYVDGMSVYTNYQAMLEGFDPTGMWVVHRNSMFNYAAATTKGGETLRDLANYVGLDPEEYKEWLSYWADMQGPPPDLDEVLTSSTGTACPQFEVPNVVLVVWMGDWWDLQATSINEQALHLEAEGFKTKKVVSTNASLDFCRGSVFCEKRDRRTTQEFLNDVSSASGHKSLHGLFIDGHGRAGHIWESSHAWQIDYQSIKNSLDYGLGAVLMNVCNGGWCAADNPQEGNLYDDGWINGELYGPPWTHGKPGDPQQITAGGRDLVSSNGVFSGLRRGLNPLTENIDIPSLFPGDMQGTK